MKVEWMTAQLADRRSSLYTNKDMQYHPHGMWFSLVLGALAFSGCGSSPNTPSSSRPTFNFSDSTRVPREASEPTCAPGEYVDVRTFTCARPETREDEYRAAYRLRLLTIANTMPTTAVSARMNFTTWLSAEELSALFSLCQPTGVTHLVLRLPTISDGLKVPVPITTSSPATAIDAAFEGALARFGTMSVEFEGGETPLAMVLPTVRSRNEFAVGLATMTFRTPSAALACWKEYATTIRLMHPLLDDLDGSEPLTEPGASMESSP